MSTGTQTPWRQTRDSSVRAILEGKKTQFREVVRLPDLQPWQLAVGVQDWHFIECNHSAENCNDFIAGFSDKRGTIQIIRSPYGKPADPDFDRPADRLWVPETYCIESSKDVAYDPPFNDGRPIRRHNDKHWGPWWEQPHYRATDPAPELEIGTGEPGVKWRPPATMPRWASRITLEITAVRVERLQSISDDDARAEGYDGSHAFPREWFALLWERIYGPGSWEASPWVWVVEFRRAQP